MTAPMTIQDLFKIILFLLGIGVLTYLLIILKNIADMLKRANRLTEENEENFNDTMKEIPKISKRVTSIVENTDKAVESIVPEVDGILHSANNITGKVESITDLVDGATNKVAETVDSVTTNISDTADTVKMNVDNIAGYIALIDEVLTIIKNIIFNK